MSFQEWVRTCARRWWDAARLSQVQDPDDNPFRSKYAARELYKSMLQEAMQFPDTESSARHFAGILQLRIGVNCIETEEWSNGEAALKEAIELLTPQGETDPVSLLEAHNQLGVLWANRSDNERALSHLRQALDLYPAAQAAPPDPVLQWIGAPPPPDEAPASAAAGADTPPPAPPAPYPVQSAAERVEELHTMTLFFLAQVYNNLGRPAASARYCLRTLVRQLAGAYDASEWARNSAALSWYYVGRRRWAAAERCLRAADAVLPGDAPDAVRVTLHQAWARFCIARLKHADPSPKPDDDPEAPDDAECAFPGLALPPVQFDGPLASFEAARAVFLAGMEHVRAALQVYVLDGYVSDHIALLCDESNLYRFLVPYEPDAERQIKMHRRRAALFEPLLSVLNPSVYIVTLRQMMYDLGDIHGEIADIRAQHHHPAKKINESALQSIKFMQMFVRSFEVDGKLPDKVEDGYVEALLSAHFTLGRMFGRLVPPTRDGLISNLQRTAELYQWVLSYRERNRVEVFQSEAAICREMLALIPLKIQALRAEAALQR